MAKGIPETKQYLLESISQNEKKSNFLKKKKKREINGNDLFTQEAYYRAYKKRSKVLPFDKDLYDDEMQNGISKNKIQNDIKKELLGNDMKAQIEKRAQFSRRRPVLEEDEVLKRMKLIILMKEIKNIIKNYIDSLEMKVKKLKIIWREELHFKFK